MQTLSIRYIILVRLDEENGYITPVTLTLTATGNGSCPGKSESIQLLVEPSISVFAGDDVTICTDQAFYTISDADQQIKLIQSLPGQRLVEVKSDLLIQLLLNTSYQPQQEDYDRGYVTLSTKRCWFWKLHKQYPRYYDNFLL